MMNEYYSYLLTIYIANLILVPIIHLKEHVFHNMIIERQEYPFDEDWQYVNEDRSVTFALYKLSYPWKAMPILFFAALISPLLFFNADLLKTKTVLCIVWAIALSAPLWMWIYDNLSISVGWG